MKFNLFLLGVQIFFQQIMQFYGQYNKQTSNLILAKSSA